ncbi:alpha/beta fold hydrolase [Bacillus testis]|uniref:alpha/beta fold hydrolase n=1 Tax=Bacillus testis TaxID=1622072 RepID=UPI00067F32BF|nr:alpha/beta fold hydrolase [Bacillus testis]
MVIINKEHIHTIPLLHVVKQDLIDQRIPLVIFLHGVTSIKERNMQMAYMLAERGYRVILPDALYHGERSRKMNIYPYFWEVVLNSIEEVKIIKEELEIRSLIQEGRIGLAGTSMGAITTLGAMGRYDWITVGVSLMGNPAYMQFAEQQVQAMKQMNVEWLNDEQVAKQLDMLKKYDITQNLGQWKERPLMFWHGGRDQVVPYEAEYAFYEQLKPAYEEKGVPISYIFDEKAGHAVPNSGVVTAVKWFADHL